MLVRRTVATGAILRTGLAGAFRREPRGGRRHSMRSVIHQIFDCDKAQSDISHFRRSANREQRNPARDLKRRPEPGTDHSWRLALRTLTWRQHVGLLRGQSGRSAGCLPSRMPRRYPAQAASAAARGSRRTRSRPSPCARSSSVACTPVSSIFRRRNARASALTIALSPHGRGAHVAPSGVTNCFRPRRFRPRTERSTVASTIRRRKSCVVSSPCGW